MSEPALFHSNLHYQEVLATLRYGIIARKGLILLLGDAGTGKTTLLQEFVRQLDTNVTCIFQSDPDVNFTDLLRLVLGNFEVSGDTRSGLSMMQRFKAILRSQLDQGQIVCLVVDNAQRLRDETLEYVLHNFFSAVPADRDENLLQVVLAGRPELKDTLAQPRLRSLKPRSEVVCQIRPLRDKEIAAYIEHRLRAADLAADVFDHAGLDRIAAYTGGNPELVNALCDHALQVAGSPGSKITPEMIARAARGLNLSDTQKAGRKLDLSDVQQAGRKNVSAEPNFELPKERDEAFRINDGDSTEVVGQTFLNYTFDDRRSWLWPAARERRALRVLLVLLLLVSAVAWLQSEAGKNQLSNWLGKQNVTIDSRRMPESDADAPVIAKPNVPPAPAPSSEISPPQTADQGTSGGSGIDTEKLADVPAPLPAQKSPEKPEVSDAESAPRKTPSSRQKDRQTQLADNPEAKRKLLEAQISRAIENRAIIGVTVSVIDNIAYLDGRVATVRQRDAAERAARGVAGVERVRNRIAVAAS
jgi:type II secretory pathway predicted ATPase ExeA